MNHTRHKPQVAYAGKLDYSVASVAPTIQMLIQMYFLLYFYVNIVGLSGGVAGTIILIARVWDFINDPLMGSLVEKSNKPGGTCLWWMKRALIPIAILWYYVIPRRICLIP